MITDGESVVKTTDGGAVTAALASGQRVRSLPRVPRQQAGTRALGDPVRAAISVLGGVVEEEQRRIRRSRSGSWPAGDEATRSRPGIMG